MTAPDQSGPVPPADTTDYDAVLIQLVHNLRGWLESNGTTTEEQKLRGVSRVLFDTLFSVIEPDKVANRRDLMLGLIHESDRGCVLVASAIIDNELELLFRDLFRSRSKITVKDLDFLLTAPLAPLKSTSIKIRFAFALGLIKEPWNKALAALQKLRSTVAAHTREEMELTADHVVEIEKHFPPEVKARWGDKSYLAQYDQMARHRAQLNLPAISVTRCEFSMLASYLITTLEEARAAIADQSSGGSSQ